MEGDLEEEEDLNIKNCWREQNQTTVAVAAGGGGGATKRLTGLKASGTLQARIATLSPGFFGPPQGPSSSQKPQNPE